jgi:hypothetical protein
MDPDQDYDVEVKNHPFDEFRTTSAHEDVWAWMIPIEQIKRLDFGYCT